MLDDPEKAARFLPAKRRVKKNRLAVRLQSIESRASDITSV
jgi:hypothetical protein